MPDHPDCVNCKAPYDQHEWRHVYRGWCPGKELWMRRSTYLRLYWPQDENGKSAKSWEPHPPLSPLEQLLVNNTETIREVLDDWLGLVDEMPILEPTRLVYPQEMIDRAHTLRREIAELTGELEN